MNRIFAILCALLVMGCASSKKEDSTSYDFQYRDGIKPRWVTSENREGAVGSGGKRNGGAKGEAFTWLEAGGSIVIADIKDCGIINRMWMTCSFTGRAEERRNVLIDIYWDGDSKAAVSVPIHDFFGMGLPANRPFEAALFSQPEARSYNSFAQMPFKKGAKIVITNQTSNDYMFFFDINYTKMESLPDNSLYFHAYWSRDGKTKLGEDFEVLPKIEGKGRFYGMNVGVICDPLYEDSWFGEGEVKMFLDGDGELPTLCGTGTEDYVGTGWGQGPYVNREQGSQIGDGHLGLYAFYRYHIGDPIYFSSDIRVTLQQMGNSPLGNVRRYVENGAELEAVSVWNNNKLLRIKEGDCIDDITSEEFPDGGVNFYRRDDVSATAYFYLDRTSTSLPAIAAKEIREANLERVK